MHVFVFLLPLFKMLLELFIPDTPLKESVHERAHPHGPDTRKFARPERMQPFSSRKTHRLGAVGHTRENRTRKTSQNSDPDG